MRSKEIEEYKAKLKLNDEQREVLVGILLGDGHLETQNSGKTYRLKIEQSMQHQAYVFHLYQLFREWVRTPPRKREVKRTGHESINLCFQTLSHSSFRFYAQQFYGAQKKSVPKLIHKWLTPRALAYWFMDDGSYKSKQSKAVLINTQGFENAEVQKLCKVLNELYDLETKPRNQKEGQQIFISGRSIEKLTNLIEGYLIPEMKYKLPIK